jgi:hypothetical protein
MKMSKLVLVAAGTLIIGLIAAPGAAFVNGDFESPNVGNQGAYYNSTPSGFGWTLASGDIDLLGPGKWQPSHGNQSLDLNGFGPGTIFQDFTFASGGQWNILFDLSGNPEIPGIKTVRVSFGPTGGSLTSLGTFSVDSNTNTFANMNWKTITSSDLNILNGQSYRLQFESLTSGAAGPALDNVRLQIVPEPTTISMVVGSIFCFAAARRRTNRKKEGIHQ